MSKHPKIPPVNIREQKSRESFNQIYVPKSALSRTKIFELIQ